VQAVIVAEGSVIEVEVESLKLIAGRPVIIIAFDGESYRLEGPLTKTADAALKAPSSPSKPLAPVKAPEAVAPGERFRQAAQALESSILATTDPVLAPVAAPAIAQRVTPHSPPEVIAAYLAEHPDMTERFAKGMSFARRSRTGDHLIRIVGLEIKRTKMFTDFVSVEPPPSPSKPGASNQWGREGSAGNHLFGGKLHKRLMTEDQQTVQVDRALTGVTQTRPKGDSLSETRAAELLEGWKQK